MSFTEPEQRENALGMRDVWSWALSWYIRPASAPDKRARQARVIEAIKATLRETDSIGALHEMYGRDCRWCIQLAQRLYPAEWSTLGVHATTAAAFGLRYVELITGRPLDAGQPLPRWLGEWAVW